MKTETIPTVNENARIAGIDKRVRELTTQLSSRRLQLTNAKRQHQAAVDAAREARAGQLLDSAAPRPDDAAVARHETTIAQLARDIDATELAIAKLGTERDGVRRDVEADIALRVKRRADEIVNDMRKTVNELLEVNGRLLELHAKYSVPLPQAMPEEYLQAWLRQAPQR